MLQVNDNGLYCPAGDFYIDPWAPVERAVITHAHSDHACPGSRSYLTARPGAALLRVRGCEAVEAAEYGEVRDMDGVRISLHPAGHILGSAQVRIEHRGEIWVVSGDYKVAPDATCEPFEPLRCHTFVTESTFGLPIFRWRPQAEVLAEIEAWRKTNLDAGKTSVLFAYPLGKAQRVLAGLSGPVFAHEAIERYSRVYRESGVALPGNAFDCRGALILAPTSSQGTPWLRQFGSVSTAFASGWMRIRGARRRRSLDRGFVLSDHADWDGLLQAIRETGASRVLATHGHRGPLARWLREQGLDAEPLETRVREEAE